MGTDTDTDATTTDSVDSADKCYSCEYTGKLCTVPFTECTDSSTSCSTDYTGTLSSAECTAATTTTDADTDATTDTDTDATTTDSVDSADKCYSCEYTGKLCTVPFTECTDSST